MTEKLSQNEGDYGDMKTKYSVISWIGFWSRKVIFWSRKQSV